MFAMNELQTFSKDMFGQIRTTIIDGEPWFVGLDIATALGYKKARSAIATHVDEDDALKQGGVDTLGRPNEMTFINESGLYALIFGSKLPSAKQFKRWVTSEVLPQINRTGGYIPMNSSDDDITIMAKAHRILERTLQEKDRLIEDKTKALMIAQPKADKYDRLIRADGYMSFNVVAKQLGTGRNRLMKYLREQGILFRDGLSNIAYQQYCERGYFVVKYSIGHNGFACGVTKVTAKGLAFLYDLLNDDGMIA